jgi:hypothetical protein
LSYSEVICLLKDMTGVGLVSKQHACNIVAQTAACIVAQECTSMAGQQLCIPFVDSVDIYDKAQSELLVFEAVRRCGCYWRKKPKKSAKSKLSKAK